ncbi:hypothetical protein [Microvirga arsenatis]|uniref:Uncharacterized protein n=1 Tax=Microvirga arsenatis TaxID=2692265 RepID=A0ABW9Z2F9_9HYPH|nr:hypothetical protein [Microvirga arsenatis]NBJ13107.1 hypothetical protein [Microvirga arsenatis]NBJ26858.1 hypothetical protein [Microvirga arsenatis]
MIAYVEHSPIQDMPNAGQVYAPDILPRLQSLLAVLADIDLAYEKSLKTITSTRSDGNWRDEMISALRRAHSEQRAPYVRELCALKERIDAPFG